MAGFTRMPVVTVDPSLTSATVSWSVDENTYGQIFYGLDSTNFDMNVEDMNFTEDHSVILPILQPNKTYSYVVNVQDSDGNTIVASGLMTFATVAAPITITDGPNADASSDSAEIAWSDSVDSVGIVNLGTDQANLSMVLTDTTVSPDHAVTAQGLAGGTKYYYVCSNNDPATGTLLVKSQMMNFTTDPTPPPTGGKLWRAQCSLRRVPKNSTSQLTVLLTKNLHAVAGAPVTFQVATNNGQIVVGSAAANSGTVNTNALGKATVTFKAGNKRGFAFVKVTSSGAVNKAFIALIIRRF